MIRKAHMRIFCTCSVRLRDLQKLNLEIESGCKDEEFILKFSIDKNYNLPGITNYQQLACSIFLENFLLVYPLEMGKELRIRVPELFKEKYLKTPYRKEVLLSNLVSLNCLKNESFEIIFRNVLDSYEIMKKIGTFMRNKPEICFKIKTAPRSIIIKYPRRISNGIITQYEFEPILQIMNEYLTVITTPRQGIIWECFSKIENNIMRLFIIIRNRTSREREIKGIRLLNVPYEAFIGEIPGSLCKETGEIIFSPPIPIKPKEVKELNITLRRGVAISYDNIEVKVD